MVTVPHKTQKGLYIAEAANIRTITIASAYYERHITIRKLRAVSIEAKHEETEMPTAKELNLNVGDIVMIGMPVILIGRWAHICYTDEKRGARASVVATDVSEEHGIRLKLCQDDIVEYRRQTPEQERIGDQSWQESPVICPIEFGYMRAERGAIISRGPEYSCFNLCERKSA